MGTSNHKSLGSGLNSFLKELKHRNVFRVAGVYAVVGWLIMQLGIVLEASLNLPSWFDTLLTVLVLVGFPVAIVLAWAFETTPNGIQPTQSAESGTPTKGGIVFDIAIVSGLVLIAGLASLQIVEQKSKSSEDESSTHKYSSPSEDRQIKSQGGGAGLTVSQNIDVTARVFSVNGASIPNARIQVRYKGHKLNELPLLSDFKGHVNGKVKSEIGRVIEFEFSARKHKTKLISAHVVSQTVELGKIELEKAAALQVDKPVHSIAIDDKSQSLEFLVKNPANETTSIRQIKVTGQKRKKTGCLTGAPSYLVTISKQEGQNSWMARSENRKEGWSDNTKVSGTLEVLPCQQMRIDFRFPALIIFAGESEEKLRIQFPRLMFSPDGERHVVNIEDWDAVRVALI